MKDNIQDQYREIAQALKEATNILIIQPDIPDGDSLGSSIALEQICYLMNKNTTMICGTTMATYLSYIDGWDRVGRYENTSFDLSIIVDTSSKSLLANLFKQVTLSTLAKHPIIIIDHHQTEATIDFASILLNNPSAVSTTEVIYELATSSGWRNTLSGQTAITAGILSDSLGLTTPNTTARSIHILGELVESGVLLTKLEEARRDNMRKSPEIVHYKGDLLTRIEYFNESQIAILVIPWEEIERYSPSYNPAILALEDMRLTTNTIVAIVLKQYLDGRITAKIRSNYGSPIAAKLAEFFGGGGHEYASGFKLTDGKDISELKSEIIKKATELINATI